MRSCGKTPPRAATAAAMLEARVGSKHVEDVGLAPARSPSEHVATKVGRRLADEQFGEYVAEPVTAGLLPTPHEVALTGRRLAGVAEHPVAVGPDAHAAGAPPWSKAPSFLSA
jgi:hypothetical protein